VCPFARRTFFSLLCRRWVRGDAQLRRSTNICAIVTSSAGHSAIYDVLVAAHVIAAVAGFGAVALSGIYGAIAARATDSGASEESARYFRAPGRAEWLILAVPILGVAALGARPPGADFGDFWVVGALLIWMGAAGLLLRVVRPAEREIRLSSATGRPSGRAAVRLKWGAAACDVLFVAALILMIAQPA
jgi:hypothetical protein